jgi:CheY-like chemotaxis protein
MKTRVAIVDDDYSSLTAMKNYCDALGVNPVAFHSPSEFMKFLEENPIDLAVLDYQMPQMNGLEIAEILASRNIPVIFVTGHREEIANWAWKLECLDCIEKPLTLRKLEKALTKFKLLNGQTDRTDAFNFQVYGNQFVRISFNNLAVISTCEVDKSHKYKFLQTHSGESYKLFNYGFEELAEILPFRSFIQINKSDIISRSAVLSFNASFEEITLNIPPVKNDCGTFAEQKKIVLTISDKYRSKVKAWLNS